MGVYAGVVYPAYLAVCALLLLAGGATLIWVNLHPWLKRVVTVMWIVTGVHAVTVVAVLLGDSEAGIVLTLGYLLASVLLLPLLGIGRLGEPENAAFDPDPNRPVLAPDQIARVDGGVAIIIAIAGAVLAWRVFEILAA
ncbi:hypothetical protein ON058_05540 [Demequina sp. B12]|uniref:hypothetical protein n=1 Tax=Demequina sp. B12 TaxID=2992757 RepID=UPI00237ACFDC|nr:hypothetical protein [Demequina sp. B12]MDE0572877.1 hypothetical protein [Demequina sp. B12]